MNSFALSMFLALVSLFFLGCSSAAKRAAEEEFKLAQEFFAPLSRIRQLTCRLKIDLPAPVLARQPELLKVQGAETRFLLSDRGCAVSELGVIEKQAKELGIEDYLEKLKTQLNFSHCVLLRAFQLRSPVEGLKPEDLILDQQEEGLKIQFRQGGGLVMIRSDRRRVSSSFPNGYQLSAQYHFSESKGLRVSQIQAVDEAGRGLLLEDFTFETRYTGLEVPQGFQLFVTQEGESPEAQVRVHLKQCVARSGPAGK